MLRNKTKRLRLACGLLVSMACQALAETAKMSDSFVDTISVQTHLESPGNYATQAAGIINAFKTSGIRHIRDGFYFQSGSNRGMDIINQVFAATGVRIKFTFTQGASCSISPSGAGAVPSDYLQWGWTASMIDAFEGMNEMNGYCGGTWWPNTRNGAHYLYDQVHAIPAYAKLPIVGPSFNVFAFSPYGYTGTHNASANVGDITAWVTLGNVHDYCVSAKPSCNFSWQPSAMAPMYGYGSLPAVTTETGYTNASPNEAQSGKYYSRLFFEYYNHGIVRTNAYELLDDTNSSGQEAQFGLLHADLSPKPAFTAITNIISILKDPGAAFTPGNFNYTLSNVPATLHHTLLQKRNGTFFLALWLENNFWDTFSPASVTVNFTGAQHVNQYDPLTSGAPKAAWNNVSAMVLAVSDQATILEISPSGAAPPTASLTANPTSIAPGGSSTLAWGSTSATSCTGAGFSIGGGASGTTSVSPAVTTNYSVSCTGSGGTASASATVAVVAPTFFTVSQPVNGANVAGTVTITGAAGTQWVNVACYTTTAKVCPDATPSGGTYSLVLDTTKLQAVPTL